MRAEVTSNSYENGNRVEIQRVIYEKSDDLFTLANLQRRYERVCKRIEETTNETIIENLQAEKEKLAAEISAMESYVAGYDDAEISEG